MPFVGQAKGKGRFPNEIAFQERNNSHVLYFHNIKAITNAEWGVGGKQNL
jgi:hypothetical protein